MKKILNFITNTVSEIIASYSKDELDEVIKNDPERMICPTCLGNCGQCGGNSHFIKIKDLKKSDSYQSGFTGLISNFGENKK